MDLDRRRRAGATTEQQERTENRRAEERDQNQLGLRRIRHARTLATGIDGAGSVPDTQQTGE